MKYPVLNLIEYDLEVYPNYFLAGFMLPDDQIYQYTHNDVQELSDFLAWLTAAGLTLCGYNSRYYDDLVLSEFLRHPSPQTAYRTSLAIIEGDLKPWNIELLVNSVDLMPILPGRHSLKKLGVWMGHSRLQELPFDPHKPLTEEQMEVIREYNANDLQITRKLKVHLMPDLALRSDLSELHNLDLRSCGEAQIAERVLVKQAGVNGRLLKDVARDRVAMVPVLRIKPPSWWDRLPINMYPTLKQIQRVGQELFSETLVVSNYQIPKGSFSRIIYIADRYYQMGVGGLHSVDGPGCWTPEAGQQMSDWDVASYYPSIILQECLQPAQWGGRFLAIYRQIVEQRLAAKKAGDKATSDVLKIVINGSFGKFGDQYSALFDPEMLAHVTVYGQLGLLVLITMLTHEGHKVVSANTDGITCLSEKSALPVIREWEALTGMVMEETQYRGFYQQNVNNYIAVTVDGKLKAKGSMAPEVDIRHSPNAQICAKAVAAYLLNQTPIEDTVIGCTDLYDFLLTSQVKGDWRVDFGDQPLGKMVRFYKSSQPNLPDIIRTPLHSGVKGNRGRIPEGFGAIPVPDLPEVLPGDINYDWYIQRAYKTLNEVTQPKQYGRNCFAEFLNYMGLLTAPFDTSASRLSRAKFSRGDVDFSSLKPVETIGVTTGEATGMIAKMVNGQTERLYITSEKFPSKTRDLIERDHGFTLVYGANVPACMNIDRAPVGGLDLYYTESELKRVRG